MSQNRSLDVAEIAALTEGRERGKSYKPKVCKNDNCNVTFIPKRSDQVFCSERCRLTVGHARNIRQLEELGARTCLWCGKEIPKEKQASAKYCNDRCRALAFKAKPCVYCGDIADTIDHFIPKAFVKRIEDFGWAKKRDIIIPCCHECNSTAGAKVFRSLLEKRRYIHERYKKRYKKLLEMPRWTEEELQEYGYSIRIHLKQSTLAQQEIKARLRWPKVLD